MSSSQKRTGPSVFDPGDARVHLEDDTDAGAFSTDAAHAEDRPGGTRADTQDTGGDAAARPPPRSRSLSAGALGRRFRWGGILFGALAGLITLALGVWIGDFITNLLAREGWLGWLAIGLVAATALAAFMLVLREAIGLWRLGRLREIRSACEAALRHDDDSEARRAVERIRDLYHGREDTAWAMARIERHERELLTGKERLTLVERELGTALDRDARALVAQSARRVSVVTAISPAPALDMLFVAAETLGMIRRLATLYGGRPGLVGLLRLSRQVLTHIILTGGLAFVLDVAHDVLGKRLVGIVAGRLGEGFFNGALTARLGIAAIEVCRPLPFIDGRPPDLRGIVRELAGRMRTRQHPAGDNPDGDVA